MDIKSIAIQVQGKSRLQPWTNSVVSGSQARAASNTCSQSRLRALSIISGAMQAKAVREEAAALNEALQAEKAAKWAADAEAEELQKQLSDTEDSLAKERWGWLMFLHAGTNNATAHECLSGSSRKC